MVDRLDRRSVMTGIVVANRKSGVSSMHLRSPPPGDDASYDPSSYVDRILSTSAQMQPHTDASKFKERMGAAHAEAEQMRDVCRTAAAQHAKARDDASNVRNSSAHGSLALKVAGARAIASHSRNVVTPRGTSFPVPPCGDFIGHLCVPEPTPQPARFTNPALELPGATISDAGPSQSAALKAAPQELERKQGYTGASSYAQRQPAAPTIGTRMSAAGATQPVEEVEPPSRVSVHAPERGGGGGLMLPFATTEDADEACSDTSDSSSGTESNTWPPRKPMLRFKMLVHFSSEFKAMEKLNKNEDMKDHKHITPTSCEVLKDMTLGWMNMVFEMTIKKEHELEIGFPIVILTMLDAIYPKRVRWREVNWQFQYKSALQKNYMVLMRIWSEVNMEKAREFRYENTNLRLESMPEDSTQDKLEFLRLMKRWFEIRIHHADPYDPIAKRQEIIKQCKAWGHKVEFPPWIHFKEADEQATDEQVTQAEWDKMPEFKRLIHFLGTPGHQKM